MTQKNILLLKLDQFIKKYYRNELYKGLLYFGCTFLFALLSILIFESLGHFNTAIRTFLFFLFSGLTLFLLGKYIISPLLKLRRLGKIISYQQAAEIIGHHFPSVNDKLLNALQLFDIKQASTSELDLVDASILKKTQELSPLPFNETINGKANRKYFKYLVPLVLLFCLIYIKFPFVITESGARIYHYRTFYVKPAPFSFFLHNKLSATMGQDVALDLSIEGKSLPEDCEIVIGGDRFMMNKLGNSRFSYSFHNLQSSVEFSFMASGYQSDQFSLVVYPRAEIKGLVAQIVYPTYIRKASEEVKGGDLTIPAGSTVNWKISALFSDQLEVFTDGKTKNLTPDNGQFYFSYRFLKSTSYSFKPINKQSGALDSLKYLMNIIPDNYPSLTVEQTKDSVKFSRNAFRIHIKDDYGFSKLQFCWKDSTNKIHSEGVSFDPKASDQEAFFAFDFLNINAKDLGYYFEVWDNDGVNGPKSAKSEVFKIAVPSADDIQVELAKSGDKLKDAVKDAINKSKGLQKDVNDLSRKLKENKNLSWEEKKKAQDLVAKEKELKQQVEDIQKQNSLANEQKEEYQKNSEEVRQQQEALAQVLEKILDPEMEKLIKEMEKMLSDNDKQKLDEKLDELKGDNKLVEKELNRTLEFYKKLEFQEKLDNSIKKLDELAKKEEDLAIKTPNEKNVNKSLEEDRKNKEQLEEIKKSIEEMKKMEEKMEEKSNFDEPSEMKEADSEMQNSQNSLQNGDKKKAGKSQKTASDKLKQASQKMASFKNEMMAKEAEDDINSLRILLENTLSLSFNQEEVMDKLRKVNLNDPAYLKLAQRQQSIKEEAKMIEDSLFALSKRAPQIKSLVNKEIGLINSNMEKALTNIEQRDVSQAVGRQQYVMTSINNLALLLNESLQQMQQQMANMKPGSGQCSKPGGKKQGAMSLSKLKQMQEQLNGEMQKAGKPSSSGGKKMSEQLAKMAAQQQYLRNELLKMSQETGEKGSDGKLNKIANQMEQTQKDLVNKNINPQTQNRQNEILTRLLEAENAERMREQDNKRQSNVGKFEGKRNISESEAYKNLKLRQKEALISVPPSLTGFYKAKSYEYFQKIGNK